MGFFIVISLIIGYAVLLWIIGLFVSDDPWAFSLKGTGMTIALLFLLFFLWMVKIILF